MKETTSSLLNNFDRIAEAPDAVPRLRRFILDLAVRGKLVEQDPNDESASELLKRIRLEKVRLVKAGEIRKSKANDPNMVEAPYDLPRSWAWAALGSIFLYDAGAKRGPNTLDQSFWLLELEDVEKDTGRLVVRVRASERASQSTKSEFQVGDILYGKLRPYLNKVLVADEPGYSTTEIVAIRRFIPLCSEYCALALRCPDFVEYVTRLGQGTKMPRLRTEDANIAPFPLPPLAEQHRIVTKVDELMALCDRLEAEQNKREQRRDRLAAASLNRINQPATSADGETAIAFREHARFHLDHLPLLTTRPEHIKSLRQTILNLAVRGRLVVQNPTDESARELLNRITVEQEALIRRKELRKKKQVDPLSRSSEPFQVPLSWIWCRLGILFNLVTDGAHHTPQYIDAGVPFLSVKDISSGRISFVGTRFISEEQHSNLCKRCCPERGDILLTKVGTTGIAVPVTTDREFSIFVSVALLKFSQPNLSQDYLCYLINSPFVRQQSADNTQGIGNKNLVLRLINSFLLPIPPLAEQHRIVAKLDELMAVCDQLEAQLATTQTDSRRLLEAVLHEALAPAMEDAA